MNKSIINATILLLIAGTFFVTNDSIIKFLSQTDVRFYHFIFYGIPIFLCFPLYLLIKGELTKFKMYKLLSTPNSRFLNIPLHPNRFYGTRKY